MFTLQVSFDWPFTDHLVVSREKQPALTSYTPPTTTTANNSNGHNYDQSDIYSDYAAYDVYDAPLSPRSDFATNIHNSNFDTNKLKADHTHARAAEALLSVPVREPSDEEWEIIDDIGQCMYVCMYIYIYMYVCYTCLLSYVYNVRMTPPLYAINIMHTITFIYTIL